MRTQVAAATTVEAACTEEGMAMSVKQYEHVEWRGRQFTLFFENGWIHSIWRDDGPPIDANDELAEFIIFLETLTFRDQDGEYRTDDDGNEVPYMLWIALDCFLMIALGLLSNDYRYPETAEMRQKRKDVVGQWKKLTGKRLTPYEIYQLECVWREMTGREIIERQPDGRYQLNEDTRNDCNAWIHTHGPEYLESHEI